MIPLIYDYVYIDAGVVVVMSDYKYGFIDKEADYVFNNSIWAFSDGLAALSFITKIRRK